MLTIREATEGDVEVLYGLIMELARHHQQERYVNCSPEALRAAGFGENPKFGALLAESAWEAVGYLSYTPYYSIWAGNDCMLLDDLFVAESHRGQQIGQRLMQQARAISEARGFTFIKWQVELDNTPAIAFYERLGAEMTEKGIFIWMMG